MKHSIKDVARLAQVSATAVSQVLNHRSIRISAAKREAILHAAQELDYTPNLAAASLAGDSSRLIGIIIPDMQNLFFAGLISHIGKTCFHKGYDLLYGTPDCVEEDFTCLKRFLHRNCDAIILVSSEGYSVEDEKTLDGLIGQMGIPVIIADRIHDCSNAYTIALDHEEGGFLATDYLLSLGHRKIGCIAGPRSLGTSSRRMDGYKRALCSYRIDFDPQLVYYGDFSASSGELALPYLLGKNVTAVFSCNDMMALGAYKACSNYNIRIPADLSIVGYDRIAMSDYLMPPLTTISQPVDEIAELSVNTVLSLLDGQATERHHVFQPDLLIRGSCKLIDI